jgi:hypothetical protein
VLGMGDRDVYEDCLDGLSVSRSGLSTSRAPTLFPTVRVHVR